jgi:hypothetical protein
MVGKLGVGEGGSREALGCLNRHGREGGWLPAGMTINGHAALMGFKRGD